MSVEVVDYAFTSVNEQALARAGKHGAGRYIGAGSDGKHLTSTEVVRIHAAGLSIWLNVEGMSGDAVKGRGLGIIHAQQAEAARKALGAPTSVPLYFAVDFDVTGTQWPLVRAYLGGAASVIGAARVGVYGGINAVTWAARDSCAAWYFQTYAWSGGRWFSGNHIEQYHNGQPLAGGTVDLCRALQANYGQWAPPGTTIPSEDDDMPKLIRVSDTGAYWLSNGAQRYWLKTQADLTEACAVWGLDANVKTVHTVTAAQLGAYGTDAETAAAAAPAPAGPTAADIAKALIAQLHP